MTGPPRGPPYWFCRKTGFGAPLRFWKKLLASKTVLRKNSKAVPWNWFVPDFVTILTVPPPSFPNSASYKPVCTLNSSIASGDGTGTPVLSGASSKPWELGLSAFIPLSTTLLSHGRPPLAEMLTLLRPVAPASMTFAVTPGDNARIWVKFRLDSGTAFIIVLSTTCPNDDVEV